MKLRRLPLVALLSILPATSALAEIDVRDTDSQMYPTNVSYDTTIPTPASVLGHELGEDPVRHHKLVEYITAVAGLSDRLTVETIGYTHERRPILFLVATSPGNHARLDEIREQHAALTEPGTGKTVTADMPVVTWLNYGVHGAEASGMDAALPFVYYLAAAQSPELDRILDESIVLVTAIFNPDGHNQRVAWLDAHGGERAIGDPAHIEHDFSWQFARTNHYWFDLNRQWLLLTQPEPRAWMKKWHEWRPNLTVDYHEMSGGQTYYFHPGVATRTNPLAPEEAERLMAETARTSEEFLDAEGRLYFHGEDFDNFYVGKGSTFPLVNGGVGILYEAGATTGRELDTKHGLRTYRENIRKHFRTSIASIEAGARLRPDYLRYQKSFYDSALRDASAYPTKAWVVSAEGDPARLHFFADLLNYHRIKTHRLGREISIEGTRFGPGDSLVVPFAQPQHRLIRSLFETIREFEDNTFYDVSTWTMPAAFGLRNAALTSRDIRNGVIGEEFSPPLPSAADPEPSNYGYVFEWGGYYAPRALQRVLEAGLLASVATKPFTATTSAGPVELSPGSILVPFDRQVKSRDDILETMRTIAGDDSIKVHSLVSGRSAIGTAGVDLGGPSFRPVKQPKALLAVGRNINLYDAGEIWHLLDYRMDMPLTLRDRDRLSGINWNDYTHIIFPHGEYDDYEPEFADRLRLWVAEGGTLIGMRNAAPWVRATTIDWVDPEDAEAPVAEPEEEDEAPAGRSPYSEKDSEEAAEVIGGAIFSADLDNTHPLGFGYDRRDIYLHKNYKEPMEPTDNPWATVIAYDEQPAYSGYVSADNEKALGGTPALIAERSGAGTVILFADNPNFRGYWYGTNKLFLNAIFFSKSFDAPAED